MALGITILTAATLSGTASGAGGPTIRVIEPEGFSNLTRKRNLVVDIYFGGVRRGEAMIAATPEAVTILDPNALLDLIPELANREAAQAALAAGQLPANSDLVCTPGAERTKCGRISPEAVGLIFDREKFRLDVFFNPSLLTIHDNVENRYLPLPKSGLSVINSIGAVLSGRSGSGHDYYNLQDQLLLAWGDRRIRADLSYATELGFGADRLAFEWDRPELRLSAGALWAPGNNIWGRQKLFGVGITTQVDTRRDKDELLGSPIVIYLDRRARVDVVRDGRVLHSAIYDAGNQQVDTSSLPEGSYDIVLKIDETGRQPREERRLYTKSRRIPSEGRTDFFAFGGLLVDWRKSGSLNPSGHPYFQGGLSHRLSRDWAVDGSLQATGHTALGEVGAVWLTPVAQLRAAVIVDTAGGYGGILQIASSGTSRLNFNLDLRRLEAPAGEERNVSWPAAAAAPSRRLSPTDAALRHESYSQASGIVSYSLDDFRFLGAFFYRDEEAQRERYTIGPSVEWDVLRQGPFTLTLRGDIAATERGKSSFAGLSVRMFGGRKSLTALAGGRASTMSDDEIGEGLVTAVSGAWGTDIAGGELALGAGFEHQPHQDDVILSSEFHHPLGSLAGDFVHIDHQGGPAVSQYSLGFQTTLAAGGGAVHVAGRTTTESMLVARVSGAREQDRFEVLVNEQLAGTIVGTGPLTLALPAYRTYDVRIRPIGADLVDYDSSSRTIGLYPGLVEKVEWIAAPVTLKLGQLVAPNGTPIRGASISGTGVWSETDDQGFFQIEVTGHAVLTVTTSEGRSFALLLPAGDEIAGIARIGPVECCGEPVIRLGALYDGQWAEGN
jgi:Mat/Ecp fimbriae outer membrane usher protein